MVVSSDGQVHTFGLGKNGQLGTGSKSNITTPTRISLGIPLDPLRVYSSDSGDVSTKAEVSSGSKFCYKVRRIFAGGDQTFVSVLLPPTVKVRRNGMGEYPC